MNINAHLFYNVYSVNSNFEIMGSRNLLCTCNGAVAQTLTQCTGQTDVLHLCHRTVPLPLCVHLVNDDRSILSQVCLNRQCQNVSVFGVHECSGKCNGRGVSAERRPAPCSPVIYAPQPVKLCFIYEVTLTS